MALRFYFQKEADDAPALGLPYGEDFTDGRTNRGFVDLRGKPYLAESIAEAANSDALKSLLKNLALEESGFFTVGCELGQAETSPPQAGGYLQFARTDMYDSALNYPENFKIAPSLRTFMTSKSEGHDWVISFTMTVVGTEGIGGPEQIWSMHLDFAAMAESMPEAIASREALLHHLSSFLDQDRHD